MQDKYASLTCIKIGYKYNHTLSYCHFSVIFNHFWTFSSFFIIFSTFIQNSCYSIFQKFSTCISNSPICIKTCNNHEYTPSYCHFCAPFFRDFGQFFNSFRHFFEIQPSASLKNLPLSNNTGNVRQLNKSRLY